MLLTENILNTMSVKFKLLFALKLWLLYEMLQSMAVASEKVE